MRNMNVNSSGNKKIRKGDTVLAIAGNNRGMTGTVLSCLGEKVIVQGLNIRKKHVKGRGDQKGSIVEIERPIHISNLKVCNDKGTPIKLHVRTNEDGERELYYRDGDQEILYRSLKKSNK